MALTVEPRALFRRDLSHPVERQLDVLVPVHFENVAIGFVHSEAADHVPRVELEPEDILRTTDSRQRTADRERGVNREAGGDRVQSIEVR